MMAVVGFGVDIAAHLKELHLKRQGQNNDGNKLARPRKSCTVLNKVWKKNVDTSQK